MVRGISRRTPPSDMWCRSPAPRRWLCPGCWTVRTGSRPPAPPAPETTPEHLTAEQSGKEALKNLNEICRISKNRSSDTVEKRSAVSTTHAATRRCPDHLWNHFYPNLGWIYSPHGYKTRCHDHTRQKLRTHANWLTLTAASTVTTHKGALTKHGKRQKSDAPRVAKTKPSHCSQRPQSSR